MKNWIKSVKVNYVGICMLPFVNTYTVINNSNIDGDITIQGLLIIFILAILTVYGLFYIFKKLNI